MQNADAFTRKQAEGSRKPRSTVLIWITMMVWLTVAGSAAGLAQAPAGAPGAAPEGGGQNDLLRMIVLFLPLVVIFWFLIIRPQRKQEKARAALLAKIEKNDHVSTIGGIHGVVVGLTDDSVTLRVDDKNDVRIKFTRKAISTVRGKDAGETNPVKLETDKA